MSPSDVQVSPILPRCRHLARFDVTIPVAMSPFWRQIVNPGRKMSSLHVRMSSLWLKVDINELLAPPNTRKWTFLAQQRAKVDMDFASATRFWHS